MMRYLIATLLVISSSFAQADTWDDFKDSNAFEPAIGCLALGAAGNTFSPDGANRLNYTLAGCAIGALIMHGINGHYEDKYTQVSNKKIEKLTESLKQFEELMANKAANQDEGPYSLRVRETVPAQRLSNGEITAPSIREKLIVPGSDFRVGE